jgi:hypothetical protein
MILAAVSLATIGTTASQLWAAEAPAAGVRIELPVPMDVATKIDARLAWLLDHSRGEPATVRKALAEGMQRIADTLPPSSDPARTLRNAVATSEKAETDTAAVDRLSAGINEARVALTFQPTMEAPLPEGFPAPGPIGKVLVKKYPAYRLARTPMKGPQQNAAFWTLFKHIQTNEIEMTAPVEMTYKAGEQQELNAESMAFLYQSTKLGKTGEDGNVQVIDVPAMTVVSVGVRGSYNKADMAEAVKQIDAWLADHKEYERAGDPRYMGYNSPMVMPIKRYGEVQIPVKKKE